MTDTRRHWTRFLLAAATALFTPLGAGSSRAAGPGKLVVTCLEIPVPAQGQGAGLAVVIQTPGGKTYLYDTGNGYPAPDGDGWRGHYNAGRDTVLPFLEARRVPSIDGVLISHGHYDHFGGLIWLADHVKVPRLIDSGYAYTGPPDPEVAAYEALRERFRKTAGAYRAVHAGDHLDLDEALDVEVISPPGTYFRASSKGRARGDVPNHFLPNANSLAVRITHGAVRILLPGDIQPLDQAELLVPSVGPEKLRCDVLVAPGHGIGAAPELARATRPKVTIASLPKRYATWADTARKVYGAVGSRVLVTGVHGRVSVTSDGRSFAVDAERPDAGGDPPVPPKTSFNDGAARPGPRNRRATQAASPAGRETRDSTGAR